MDETNFKSSIRNSSFAGKKSQVKIVTQSRVKAMDFDGGRKSKIPRSWTSWATVVYAITYANNLG